MRFTIERTTLQRVLRVFDRIIPKRGGLPHQYVLNVEVDSEGGVTIWGSSTKEMYQTVLGGGEDTGRAAIPAAELIRAVAVAPGAEVTVESTGQGARVESGSARWNLEGLEGVLYADPPVSGSWGEAHRISAAELRRVLEAVRYAASRSESRPSFMQIHFQGERAVAADGRRVHQERFEAETGAVEFNLPERAVDTLLDVLSSATDEMVAIQTDEEGSMRFWALPGQYEVTRLNYNFPDLDSLVLDRAREQGCQVTCDLSGLITAVKVATVVVEDEPVRLRFTTGVIEIQGQGGRSEGRMELSAETSTLPSRVELAVNPGDLLDLLGRMDGEEGQVTFTIDPGVDPGWLYFRENGMEAAIRPVVV